MQILTLLNSAYQASIYASKANILNVALFGKTASQWRLENPSKGSNIGDIAKLEQLVMPSNK